MLASLYAAGICLGMFFSIQAVLRLDLCAGFGTVGEYVSKAAYYALTFVFLADSSSKLGAYWPPPEPGGRRVTERRPPTPGSPQVAGCGASNAVSESAVMCA